MFSMDELNSLEMKRAEDADLIAVYFKHPEYRMWRVKRFKQIEIDKALDYFNEKKRMGLDVRMKKVVSE